MTASSGALEYSTLDYFLLANASSLNWSYLDCHWEKEAMQDDKEEKNQKNKVSSSSEFAGQGKALRFLRLTIAYGAGMVGHALTATIKIVQFVAFVFISLGLAVYSGWLYARHFCEKPDKKEDFPKAFEIKKYQLVASLLILGGTIGSFAIDAIGIACPPAAYGMHHVMQETCILNSLIKLGAIPFPDKENPFTLGHYMNQLLKK